MNVDELIFAIRTYVNDRFDLSMVTLSADESMTVLISNAVSFDTATRFKAAYSRVEEAVYTGGSQKNENIHKEILDLVNEIEKEIP